MARPRELNVCVCVGDTWSISPTFPIGFDFNSTSLDVVLWLGRDWGDAGETHSKSDDEDVIVVDDEEPRRVLINFVPTSTNLGLNVFKLKLVNGEATITVLRGKFEVLE